MPHSGLYPFFLKTFVRLLSVCRSHSSPVCLPFGLSICLFICLWPPIALSLFLSFQHTIYSICFKTCQLPMHDEMSFCTTNFHVFSLSIGVHLFWQCRFDTFVFVVIIKLNQFGRDGGKDDNVFLFFFTANRLSQRLARSCLTRECYGRSCLLLSADSPSLLTLFR